MGVLLLAGVLGAGLNVSAQSAVDANALNAVMTHFSANAGSYGLTSPAAELKVRSGRRAETGEYHIRLDQYYLGVPVYGGQAIGHVAADGRVTVTSALRRIAALSVTPLVTARAAETRVAQEMGLLGAYQATSVLRVLPGAVYGGRDRLAWHVVLMAENAVDKTAKWTYFIDAQTAEVAFRFDSLHTTAAKAWGRTMFSGNVALDVNLTAGYYFSQDLLRSGNYTTDMNGSTFGNGAALVRQYPVFGNWRKDLSDRATAAADAHFGLQATWDYYKTLFGRNGIDGNGRRTFSRVHYGNSYENAFWDGFCFCMTYGDGAGTFYPLVSLDVAGHEMSHGVMETEADLFYFGESGGLNESNSDIFGTMVEYAVNSTVDVPDYWIGERLVRSNWSADGTTFTPVRALRYMDDPEKDGRSPSCWYPGIGNIDVHYSSGPANHMFYLLAEGGMSKCNGNSVTGIGREAASRIWYDAVTNRMTATTNYSGARTASVNAAGALYGANSAQQNAVKAAFAAINVP